MEISPDHNIRLLRLSTLEEATREVERVGVDRWALPVLAFKALGLSIKVERLDCAQSNIIKQTALAEGADAAVARSVVTGCSEKTDLIIFCNRRQVEGIIQRLKIQPFGLKEIADGLQTAVDSDASVHKLALREHGLDLSKRTHVMGVLNVTPDSFSDGGEHFEFEKAINWGMKMSEDGADILDIGGESTRPGADPVTVEEELSRVLPVIDALAECCNLPLSIDTRRSRVAHEALKAGCTIVNDISGLTSDGGMADTVSRANAALIIGHIRGTPRDMQKDPYYRDTMSEIVSELRNSIQLAESGGVEPSKIVVDPGIGFGKRLEDNLSIVRRLGELKSLGKPIMVGPSRKSFIGAVLDLPVKERLEGTAAAIALSIANGANLVRVHDVKEMKRVCLVADAIVRGGQQ